MKPLHQFDSTDIAQICHNSDGRFDDLHTGGMVDEPNGGLGDAVRAVLTVLLGVVIATGVALWVMT